MVICIRTSVLCIVIWIIYIYIYVLCPGPAYEFLLSAIDYYYLLVVKLLWLLLFATLLYYVLTWLPAISIDVTIIIKYCRLLVVIVHHYQLSY